MKKKNVKAKKNNKVSKIIKNEKTKEKTILPKNLIEECRQKLIAKQKELANINYKNEDIFPEVGDDIDLAKNALDKEILQELSDTQQNLLNLISIALEKIEQGTYGQCENCKKTITIERIKALPWARYCINCQTNKEHN